VIEKFPKFEVILDTRPSIAKGQLLGLEVPIGKFYPLRALREEREGVETFECQIQQDLSLICSSLTFEPVANAPFFEGAGERNLAQARAPSKLVDGQSSVGARFKTRVRWTIPNSF
jgi:hypothetical protein